MNLPQQLDHQAVEEFQAIYLKEFQHNLTDDEAQEMALRVLRLFDLLLKPGLDAAADSPIEGQSRI